MSKWRRAYLAKRNKLNEQLSEDTGRHMLDSGGAYGRQWERNQKHPPKDKPSEWYEWHVYGGKLEGEYTKNTLDVLCEWLDEGPTSTWARRSWGQFLRQEERREAALEEAGEYRLRRSWEELLEAWAEQTGCTAKGGRVHLQ